MTTGPRERPILFSGTMTRAILDGSKTQTRRVVNPSGRIVEMKWSPLHPERGLRVTVRTGPRSTHTGPIGDHLDACPYGQPGDRLWAKETWRVVSGAESEIGYRATASWQRFHGEADPAWWRRWEKKSWSKDLARMTWVPSIYMPRWASRITLEVTSVRVERLHEITEADARAEGMAAKACADCAPTATNCPECLSAREAFSLLWGGINGTDSWVSNPWVWVVSFKRIEA